MSHGSSRFSAVPWGGQGPAALETVAADRILMFTRGPRFRALMEALARRGDALIDVMEAIREAFDLDSAEGVHLDRIGQIVQQPRGGAGDDLYRRMLRAQIDIILSSQAGAETLLAVVLALTGLAAPEYSEFYPASFVIGAYIDPDLVTLLATFIRRAKGSHILGQIAVYPPGAAPGAGGVLLGDLTDEGVWSLVINDRTFAARMTAAGADDLESEQDGTLDGTAHVPAFEARSFNGTTDRIDWITPPLDLSLGQPFTIAAWVRWDTLVGLDVILTAASTGPTWAAIFRISGASLDYAHAYTAGTALRRTANNTFLTGQWYHVAVTTLGTATAADVHLYVDGVETGYSLSTNGSGTPRAADGSWSVGGRIEADGNNHDGDIASVDVWPRALGPEEIAHLYAEGIASGAFAGPPDETPTIDNPGVADLVTPTYALAYPTASLVTV